MRQRILGGLLALATFAGAATATASQFIPWSLDRVAAESSAVVRGQVTHVWSAWDDAGSVIHTYATLQVDNWMAGSGSRTITVREIGGTVNGYTQEAIGFPVLREGESVVLFLTKWDDSSDFRIQAYSQGKYLVRRGEDGRETVARDRFTQGHTRHEQPDAFAADETDAEEFELLVRAALRGNQR